MLKLIFSDLDGTLLNSKKEISKETLKMLNKLKSKNIAFFINTGRLPCHIEFLKEHIDNANLVCGNGSYVLFNNKLIYNCPLEKNDVYALVKYAYQKNIIPRMFSKNDVYYTSKPFGYSNDVPIIANLTELDHLIENDGIYKIGFFDYDKKVLDDLKKHIDNHIKNIQADFSTSTFLECHHINTSKGKAIDMICEQLNIQKDEVLAIGDNENDLTMFNRGYHSACPFNACDKVKELVEYISPLDCNHNSMVDIINHFI